MSDKPWLDIELAPKDGTPVEIQGLTFIEEDVYTATAVWTTRRCPKHPTEGWFPATDKHDGMGPYEDVKMFRRLPADD